MLHSCPRTARLAFAALSCIQTAITGCSRAEVAALPTPPPSPPPVRRLAMAMQIHDVNMGSPALLKVLADLGTAVNSGKSVGAAIQELLQREGFSGTGHEPLRQTLLANWHSAWEFGLFTPENLELMRAGKLPVVTIGGYRGQATVILPVPGENGAPSGYFRLMPVALGQTIAQSTTAGTAPAVAPPPMPFRNPAAPNAVANPATIIDYVEIALGDGISLEKYGGGSEKIFINTIKEKEGIQYGMGDPTKMQKVWVQGNPSSGVGYPINMIKLVPNTTYHTAPWAFAPIPGTSETGILVTTYKTASVYFVKPTIYGGDRYRMCIVATPGYPPVRPKTASPRPR